MNELWGAPKRVNVIQMSLGENKRVPPLKSKESRWRRPTWRASSGVREGVNVLVFCSEFPQKFNAAFKTGSRLAGEYTSAAAALHLRHPLAKLPNLDKDLYANSEGKKENTGFRMEFREMATAIMRNEIYVPRRLKTCDVLPRNLQGDGAAAAAARHCPILSLPAAEARLAEAAGATAGRFLRLLQRRVARRILRGLWKGLSSDGNTIGIVRLTRSVEKTTLAPRKAGFGRLGYVRPRHGTKALDFAVDRGQLFECKFGTFLFMGNFFYLGINFSHLQTFSFVTYFLLLAWAS